MARGKPKSATRSKATPSQRRSTGRARRRFAKLPQPVLVASAVILAALLLLVILGGWAYTVWDAVWSRLGLGLVVVILAIARITMLVRRRRLLASFGYWNRWAGLAALAFGVVGGLSFFSIGGGSQPVAAGGALGTGVIGARDALGVLRIIGLLLLTALFLAPRQSGRVLTTTGKEGMRVYRSRPWEAVLEDMRAFLGALKQLRTERRPGGPSVERPIPLEIPVAARWDVDEHIDEPALGEAGAAVQKALPLSYDEAEDSDEPDAEEGQLPQTGRWQLPPADILEQISDKEIAPADNRDRARLIEEALASYGVEAKVVQINPGPAVTQFGVEPGWDHKYREIRERDEFGRPKLDKDGKPKVRIEEVSRTRVKVERITALSNNLALALAAPTVRIEAPVPGKSVVGIEVPNQTMGVVSLRSVVESPSFQRAAARSKLALALGKGVAGEAVGADLAKMPHLLIAGATGSGKSVCINSIISCLLMHATPEEVRFLMVDPKRVELVGFNSVPHLLAPVVVDMDKVVGTLRWVAGEMDRRYRALASAGARNIEAYNRSPRSVERMPYWVIIIDELADLMMAAPYEVERTLCRLAQLARAVGIHLIVATQRPSVDVVTGLIKANFPTRIAFAVTSQVDSRTILDGGGAEKLLGRGDMLYMPTDAAKPKRLQGTFVSDQEIERLVNYWASARFSAMQPRQFTEEIEGAASAFSEGRDEAEEQLLEKARALAREHNRISASLLQRRLRIGYNRAARIIDEMEEEGIIGPAEDGRSREVLIAGRDRDEEDDLREER